MNKRNILLKDIEKNYLERISSKEQLVYFLNRFRVFLELENLKKNYPVLLFYCNWIAHCKINKVPNSVLDSIENIKETHDTGMSSFWIIRDDLCKFATDYNFEKKLILNNHTYWNSFTYYLLEVISRTPLLCDNIRFEFSEPKDKENSYFSSHCNIEINMNNNLKKISMSYRYYNPNNNSLLDKDWLTEEGKCK